MKQKLYSTAEVAKLTGVSLRQLQFWDERGIVQPAEWGKGRGGGSGRYRRYSEDQLRLIRRMAKLRRAGVSLQKLRPLLRIRTEWDSVVVLRKPEVRGGVLVVPAR